MSRDLVSWRKLGLVIKPSEDSSWRKTHAMLPTPYCVEGSLYRIYFGGRNANNQSSIGYALIDLDEPDKVLEYQETPVLVPGRLGTFDDNGVLPSCVIAINNRLWMYTIGFKPGGTTRMDLFGGLAYSLDNGESFMRYSEAPLLERIAVNPFINTAPWIVNEAGGFRMYYVAGYEWVNPDLPRYNIQTAYSRDGIDWQRNGTIAIDFEGDEDALARPYVVVENNIYKMWFSAKGKHYLPKYAESHDGVNWTRINQEPNIQPDVDGPDSDMICYPVVIRHKGNSVMFYNGNGYGKHGVCVAVQD